MATDNRAAPARGRDRHGEAADRARDADGVPGDGRRAPRVVLATRNPHKVTELRRILAGCAVEVDLVGLDEFPGAPPVVESGLTFEENALRKARSAAAFTGLPAVADDSGLCVDALNGMPGVLSALWAGRHGDDEANLHLVLAQLADIDDRHRGAHFVCAAALVLPSTLAPPAGRERVVTGRLDGTVTRVPRGSGGFGYDPIFVPEGSTRTTAEMAPQEKDAISHRGRAFRALAAVLDEELGERWPGGTLVDVDRAGAPHTVTAGGEIEERA